MKKLHIAIISVVSFVFVLIISVCLFFQDKDCIHTVCFECVADDNVTEKVSLFYDESSDCYFAFLPSYAEFKTMKIEYRAGYELYLNNQYIDSDSDLSALVTDVEYPLIIKNSLGLMMCNNKLIILKSENVPALSLSLIDGSLDEINFSEDKSVSKTGTCTMICADGTVDYSGGFKQLKGRGNSTWTDNKKPYNFSFNQAVDLLHMGENQKYCLLSNARDSSKIRNKLVFDAAKEYGVDYAVDSEFVDLYVDHEYLGLYLMTESINVSEDRISINPLEDDTQKVNYLPLSEYDAFSETIGELSIYGSRIPSNPEDITGGYLLESDLWFSDTSFNSMFSVPLFNYSGTMFIMNVKYPEYTSQKQIEYISTYFSRVQDSFSDDFEHYIDVDSFVKYYIIKECFANYDIRSVYFYKDSDKIDDKLHMGPVWDFDMSLGISWLDPVPPYDALYIHTWGVCQSLYENERFVEYVQEAYPNFLNILQNILDVKLDYYSDYIKQSYQMNRVRWLSSNEYNAQHAEGKATGLDSIDLDDNVEFISNFLSNRIGFLNTVFLEGKKYASVYLNTNNPNNQRERYLFTVETGKTINEDSTLFPKEDGYTLLGFFDVNTGEKFDFSQPITNNAILKGEWEIVSDDYTSLTISDKESDGIADRIISFFSGEEGCLNLGLAVIGITIIFCLLIDLRQGIWSRRYRNGRKR